MFWLFKEDPESYSFDQLLKDKKAAWSGVKNNLALIHLRNVRKGDEIFFYATGKERKIIGVMKALGDACSSEGDILKSRKIAVDVAPTNRLIHSVTLEEIKKDGRFKDFLLLKISRLSVMPVSDQQWAAIMKMSSQV
ncbi:MAG: EVE domain-containing protein [Nitrososphaerales archaeon]